HFCDEVRKAGGRLHGFGSLRGGSEGCGAKPVGTARACEQHGRADGGDRGEKGNAARGEARSRGRNLNHDDLRCGLRIREPMKSAMDRLFTQLHTWGSSPYGWVAVGLNLGKESELGGAIAPRGLHSICPPLTMLTVRR